MFDYRILGPLDVRWAGESVPITAPKERDLLVLLLLRAERTVSAEELIDGIWGNSPPVTARTTLQNYIKRLRQALGAASGEHQEISTCPGGYVIQLDRATLDLREFERLSQRAIEAKERGELAAASSRLRAALTLWRGMALAGSRSEHLVHVEAPRLEGARIAVFEHYVDAELRLGRHREIITELQSQIVDHPLREGLHTRLLVALYRSGRRSDALTEYQRARRRLIRDIGLEPGPELTAVHRRILADDESLLEPGGSADDRTSASLDAASVQTTHWALPAQLPSCNPVFIGRDDALRTLDSIVPRHRETSPGAVGIGLVTGEAGVGKTALVLRWGHLRRNRFPDGQLYANLRGYETRRPAQPIDVLNGFLQGLGVPAQRVPADEESAAALYRSLCAGKELLIVLDNARSAAQVRPLVPGNRGCLVLVTSRDALGGLVARDGALPIPLDVLKSAEAEEFLARVVGGARVRAEPAAAQALTSACACLPLAVGVTAADLALHPARTLADQVARLGDEQLTALQIEGDEQSGVRVVLEASYGALEAAAARMFRLLGLMPGTDISVSAAASLAAVPDSEAARLLGQLVCTHLLNEGAPGRHTFHDLLRAYARERAYEHEREGERAAALARLYQWYLATVDAAVQVCLPEALRLPVEDANRGLSFADASAALEWLDTERANIVAVVRHAGDHGFSTVAWTLADAIRPYLMQRAHASEWIEVASAGLAAAQADGNLSGRAAAHRSLSSAYLNQSAYDESKRHDLKALDLYRRTGAVQGQSATLNSLALSSWYTGRLKDALAYGEQSMDTSRRAGFRTGEAIALGNVGSILHEMGRLVDAQSRLTETLDLCSGISGGAPTLAAITRRNLGVVLFERGRVPAAVATLAEAAEMQRNRAGHIDLSYTLFWLAVISLQSGDRAQALEYIERGAELRTGEARAQSDLHTVRGLLSKSVGNHGQAVRHFTEAGALARQCGARTQELRALLGLAESHVRMGALAEARVCVQNARNLAGGGEYGLFHARALTLLAEVELGEQRVPEAGRLAAQSSAFCREANHPMGMADALLVLGFVRQASSQPEEARRAWRQAAEVYEPIGAARATEARALLAGGKQARDLRTT